MPQITFARALPADAARLNVALRKLSEALGDRHRANDAEIAAALSDGGSCRALIAEHAGAVIGVALFSPLFSTTRGMAGLHVSDLWVDDAWRSAGLGPRLLAGVRDEGARLWRAGFLRLSVHADNARARAFYDRLGFVPSETEHLLTLTGPALAALKETP